MLETLSQLGKLHCVNACMHAGITALDLAHTPCSDQDVAAALAKLPRLASLRLDNCRKLSSDITSTVFSNAQSQLHTLCLQRCFQVIPATLVHALATASGPNSSLATLTLSHIHFEGPLPSCSIPLDLSTTTRNKKTSKKAASSSAGSSNATRIDATSSAGGRNTNCKDVDSQPVQPDKAQQDLQALERPHLIPSAPTPPAPGLRYTMHGSSLRFLALSCCDGLTLSHLTTVAMYAPRLQVLLLGGTTLNLPQPPAAGPAPAGPPEPPHAADSAAAGAGPAEDPAVAARQAQQQEWAVFGAISALARRTRAALEHEAAVEAAEAAEEGAEAGAATDDAPGTARGEYGAARRPLSTLPMCAV